MSSRNPKQSHAIPNSQEHSFECPNCDRQFKTNSGLWRHKKTCTTKNDTQQSAIVNILLKQNEMIMHQNKELQLQTNKKDDEFRTLIIELCKNTQTIHAGQILNNSNNNNNNNNNTFNLHVFLNETCKDAINLSDFIESVKVSFEDIEKVGSLGYVDGTSEVIIKHLNDLGVEKRPIQCTDAKRQTLYIKENNEWTKEDSNFARMQRLVDDVQRVNLRQLSLWREKHPACLTSNSIYTSTYNNMSQELMGGDCSNIRIQAKDNKIINKVIKNVIVDKQKFIDV